jgi:hypothetical protein
MHGLKGLGETNLKKEIRNTGYSNLILKEKSESMLPLGLKIQSLIARALDQCNYTLMASIDLYAAFNAKHTPTPNMSRSNCLTQDLIELIKVWLTDRPFYVSINVTSLDSLIN